MVLFCVLAPVDRLKALLTVAPELVTNLIRDYRDIPTLLIALDAERAQVLCESAHVKIITTIRSSYNFVEIIKQLSAGQRAALYSEMSNTLPKLVNSIFTFISMIEGLSLELQSEVYLQVKYFLPKLINEIGGLANFATIVSPRLIQLLFTVCSELFPEQINSAVCYARIFELLNPLQRQAFYMQTWQAHVIHSSSMASEIFNCLFDENHTEFYMLVKNNFPELIRTITDVVALLIVLNKPEREDLYEKIRHQLPAMITCSADLYVVDYLNQKQRKQLISSLIDTFFSRITVFDLNEILSILKIDIGYFLLTKLNPSLPMVIESTNNLSMLLQIVHHPKLIRGIYETLTGYTDIQGAHFNRFESALNELNAVNDQSYCMQDLLITQTKAQEDNALNLPKLNFAIALFSKQQNTEIKSHFDRLIKRANTHRSRFFTFGYTRPCKALLDVVSNLDVVELLKLNNALHLNLDFTDLFYPELVKNKLIDYIDQLYHPRSAEQNSLLISLNR